MFNFHPYHHQQALIDSKSRQSFIIGPRATGKTMGLLAVMASRLRRGHGARYHAAIVCGHPGQLDYLMEKASEAFEWVRYSVVCVPYQAFVFPDGGTLRFQFCRTGEELHRMELNVIAVDHLTQFTGAQYERMLGGLRDLPEAPARIVASVEKQHLFEPLPDWIEDVLAPPATSLYLTEVLSERPKRRASGYLNLSLGTTRPIITP